MITWKMLKSSIAVQIKAFSKESQKRSQSAEDGYLDFIPWYETPVRHFSLFFIHGICYVIICDTFNFIDSSAHFKSYN